METKKPSGLHRKAWSNSGLKSRIKLEAYAEADATVNAIFFTKIVKRIDREVASDVRGESSGLRQLDWSRERKLHVVETADAVVVIAIGNESSRHEADAIGY